MYGSLYDEGDVCSQSNLCSCLIFEIRHRGRFIEIRYEHTQKKAQFPRTVIVSYDAVRGKFSDWPISNG